MKQFLTFTYQNSQNVVLTIVTTISFLAAIILPFTNQLSTDSGGWQMILFAGAITSAVYLFVFGAKSIYPYISISIIAVLSTIFCWLAFIPLFLASVTVIFWRMAYNEYQASLVPPTTTPQS